MKTTGSAGSGLTGLLRVIAVVETDADDLARAPDRGPDAQGAGVELGERVERIRHPGEAVGGEEGRVEIGCDGARIEGASGVADHGDLLAGRAQSGEGELVGHALPFVVSSW